jgi:2-succinyl-6-hydroxy-2,4-cyclohexadiene-1-carboxylate synthase
VNVNGIEYHVVKRGSGEQLILLHGFTGSAANWNALIDRFAPHFTVIAPDLLGHGQTESPADPERYRIERAADDLAAIMRCFSDSPVNLLGYSMGGRLALYTALHYPTLVRRLLLESASPGLEDDSERQARRESDNALAERIERDGIAAFVEYWEALPLFATQTPEMRQSLRAGRLANDSRGLANSLRGMGTGVQPPLWDRLGDVRMPVHLIAGRLDTKFTAIARRMHDLIPNSHLDIIPNAGHTVHLEQPELFGQIVLGVLSGERDG